jgi:predicted tellurium resistance membrane protein TerC
MIAGVLGAIFQLEIALQLVRESRSLRTVLGLVVLLIGGVIAAASLPDWHFEYLLQGEIVFQVGFAWCLIEWTYALADRMRRA